MGNKTNQKVRLKIVGVDKYCKRLEGISELLKKVSAEMKELGKMKFDINAEVKD